MVACDPTTASTPHAPYGLDTNDTLENVSFMVLRPDGTESALDLYSYVRPCGDPEHRVLVLRVEAPWCGPCQVSARHVDEALAPFAGHGVDTLNVLFSGRDNGPATLDDLRAWRQAYPALPGLVARGVDAKTTRLVSELHVAPSVFVIDPASMTVLSIMDTPTSYVLRHEIAEKLARIGGDEVAIDTDPEAVFDDRFDPERWELLQGMAAPTAPPIDTTNAYADDPTARSLGAQLFVDTSLAGSSGVSCATCHDPQKGFSDGRSVALGVGTGTLSTPSITMASYDRWMFWDGRADSLWSQALGPIENPIEMNGSRLAVAHRIATAYRDDYEQVFGMLPSGIDDLQQFPPDGKPGSPSYDAMNDASRDAIDRVYANVGKAIEAYERTIPTPTSRLDDYVAGHLDALTPHERDGMKLYLVNGCATCHFGPTLSDHAFHNIRMPSTPDGTTAPAARGRIDGIPKLLASEFRADGFFSDDPTARPDLATLVSTNDQLGQLKTPTLRGLVATAPYGHAGLFPTLEKVIDHYTFQQAPVDDASTGARDVTLRRFHAAGADRDALIAFLRALGGAPSASSPAP